MESLLCINLISGASMLAIQCSVLETAVRLTIVHSIALFTFLRHTFLSILKTLFSLFTMQFRSAINSMQLLFKYTSLGHSIFSDSELECA